METSGKPINRLAIMHSKTNVSFSSNAFSEPDKLKTADNGAERWTACEKLDGSFAPFSVSPHEQIEEIFIRQIAGFAYFIVDGKIS